MNEGGISIFFDIEVGKSVGLGHLSRCVALAEEFKASGHEVFLNPLIKTSLIAMQMIEESGISPHFVVPPKIDVLIADRYSPLEETLRLRSRKVVQLVDQSSTDLIADIYICASPCNNWVNTKTVVKHFENEPILRRNVVIASKEITYGSNNRVLILFGGSNQEELQQSVINEARNNPSGYELDLYVASSDRTLDLSGTRVGVRGPDEKLFEVLSEYELVISSAGVLAWELISMRKQICFYSLVENQDYQLEVLREMGFLTILELDSRKRKFENLHDAISVLKKSRRKPTALISLEGSKKVVSFIRLNL